MSAWQIPLAGVQPQFTSPTQVAQQRLSLQQLAGQVAIQKQMQAENDLKIQAAQKAQQDQQTIQDEFNNNAGDYDKTAAAIRGKVSVAAQQAFDKDHLTLDQAFRQAALSKSVTDKQNLQNFADLTSQIGDQLEGVYYASPNDKQARWASGVQTIRQLPGADKAAWLQNLPETVPDDKGLEGYMAQANYLGKHAQNALKLAQVQNAQAKTQTSLRQNDAAVLSEAADADEYREKWEALPPERRAQFPNPDDYDEDSSPEQIRQIGMTPEQQERAGLTKEQRDAQRERNSEIRRHNQAMEAFRGTTKGPQGQTANSVAVDQRAQQREFDALVKEEEKTAPVRKAIENGILSNGKTYVDQRGNVKDMDKVTTDPETSKALTQSMREQYEVLTNRMKRIATDKNMLLGKLGGTIGTPTDKVHAALDADLQRVLGTSGSPAPATTPATPATQPPATPTPATQPRAPGVPNKVFPRWAANKYSAEHQIPQTQVDAQLKAQGYVIDETQTAPKR